MEHFELEHSIQRLRLKILQSNQDLLTITHTDALSLIKKIESLETVLQELLRSIYEPRKNIRTDA